MSECGPEGPVIAREGRNVDCLIDFILYEMPR
jgi:hypothetical protein